MNDEAMMDMSNDNNNNDEQVQIETIPRVNGEMLLSGNFTGSEVSIVGKYLGNDNDNSTIKPFEASDGEKFNVKLNMDEPWDGYKTRFIEIRGIVSNDGSIQQISYQEYGNEFAMATWDKFVRLTHQYPNLF